jgi:hypothetical protein
VKFVRVRKGGWRFGEGRFKTPPADRLTPAAVGCWRELSGITSDQLRELLVTSGWQAFFPTGPLHGPCTALLQIYHLSLPNLSSHSLSIRLQICIYHFPCHYLSAIIWVVSVHEGSTETPTIITASPFRRMLQTAFKFKIAFYLHDWLILSVECYVCV